MDLKSVAKATSKVLISYLTYQAMRTVVSQLQQTNPPLAHWLSGFSSTGKLQDGEMYLKELLSENQELAFRLMTVRAHLAEEVVEFLPEMTLTGVKEANLKLRCQHLEKIVNYESSADLPDLDPDLLAAELLETQEAQAIADDRQNDRQDELDIVDTENIDDIDDAGEPSAIEGQESQSDNLLE
ncbi:chaperonin family protein RbcX [Thalassoporum mexicanum PCC 7367]|nr:chaperonin family protein RbcX [Pseudanabaena sp. PCC 7367]AFY69217.1 chaperonin family protein RbcX [Pseudanabaena sp. PCC 7367]